MPTNYLVEVDSYTGAALWGGDRLLWGGQPLRLSSGYLHLGGTGAAPTERVLPVEPLVLTVALQDVEVGLVVIDGPVMLASAAAKRRQHFVLGRGEERIKRFRILGGAGRTSAALWHCAATDAAGSGEHEIDLGTDDGTITLMDHGADCLADLHLTADATEGLTPGYRHHELWATINGLSAIRAHGLVTVRDTLKS